MRMLKFTEITHPLLDATRACQANNDKALIPFHTGRGWFSRFKTPVFRNIRVQYDGDMVRAQAFFADSKHPPRHKLMTMAAVLTAQHQQFRLNKKPLAIPCSGKSMTMKYYNQANQLLNHNIAQLQKTYNHYLDKLTKANKARCLNKLKQIQQMLAGALFMQQQYMFMQTNDAGHKVMTMSGYEKAELASRQIAQQFCSAGLNDPDSQPALHQAAINGNVEQLCILLNNPDTAINQCNFSGHSALYMAAQHNQLKAVKLLIDKQPFIPKQPQAKIQR
ncbi:MAG: ankyrin repeat domain-containing protein [Coxiellaceae bacterium]|nr:ankyrin repeat domain-containing protein [Coxiellaceae bacterium]